MSHIRYNVGGDNRHNESSRICGERRVICLPLRPRLQEDFTREMAAASEIEGTLGHVEMDGRNIPAGGNCPSKTRKKCMASPEQMQSG